MSIFFLIIFSLSNTINPEPQLGYWVCDIIRQEKNIDFVLLPESALSTQSETLIISPISINELNQLIYLNLMPSNLIPLSGFNVVVDSASLVKIAPNQVKEKGYFLLTTKSLAGLSSITNHKKISTLNQTITDILISYLGKGNQITEPKMNRYQFMFQSSYAEHNEQFQPKLEKISTKININTATLEELD
jgi:DNA uptake protein ComE-like DNA-binding protein